jgi:wyosine [tRNA(Phe)-imidazoG37] synthetase (radical SAM superfamily)
MKYIFGPVPSRRLGRSLGIDTIPLKTCNWNCIYCQLGRSRPLINERQEYYPREEILEEVREALTKHKPGEIDWVTFVGSGEPTLHASLGWLIRQVKKITDLPVAVITNGALLYLPEVRQDILPADAVLPSLDAGNAKLYRKVNRPHPEITYERLLGGLAAFRLDYKGKLWVEVMLVRGLNDTEEALRAIASRLEQLNPDEVHINLPTRPPVETWVRPPDEEGLMRASAILGDIARVVHPAESNFNLSSSDNILDAVVGIITRHPMPQEELERTLSQSLPGGMEQILTDLETSGQAQVVERFGVRFWVATPSYFPDDLKSQTASPDRSRTRNSE